MPDRNYVGCKVHTAGYIPVDTWNTRPIEHALNAELAQLRKDNQSLVEQVNAMARKIDGLEDFISGLDECDIYDTNNLSRELETYFKGVTNV